MFSLCSKLVASTTHSLARPILAIRMASISSRAVFIRELGDPKRSLELRRLDVSTNLQPEEVLVKWLASPINPLDINRVEGTYPDSYAGHPAGSEGVGVIEKAGSGSKLKPGNWVVPFVNSDGIWTEYSVVDSECLIPISSKIDLRTAATFMINPPTAYVMLKEYVELEPGDWIIQNSANSGVGQAVIQIAKAFGYKTINLVRDRPNIADLKQFLTSLGADIVLTEDEFKAEGRKLAKTHAIKLALNGVGGRSALMISSALTYGGTIVTYGGMSKKPHEISTSAFVFNNVRAFGTAVGRWMIQPENRSKVDHMFAELEQFVLAGKFQPPPMKVHDVADFATAIEEHLNGKSGKQLLLIHPDSHKLVNKL